MFIEPMESRVLLSVVQTHNRTFVSGTPGDDQIIILSRGDEIVFRINGRAHRMPAQGAGRIKVRGGGGDDFINARKFTGLSLELFGDAGNDRIHAAVERTRVHGGDGNDRLQAWGDRESRPPLVEGNTVTLSLADGDELSGGPGDDLLVGGPVQDFLEGGAGADRLFGGAGDDVLNTTRFGADRPDRAPDSVYGGEGQDTLYYDNASDIFESVEHRSKGLTPHDPASEQVDVVVKPPRPGAGSEARARVSIAVPSSDYFFRFGDLSREGNIIRLEALAYNRTDKIVLPAFDSRTKRASLGTLGGGSYFLELIGHGGQVLKTRAFKVPRSTVD